MKILSLRRVKFYQKICGGDFILELHKFHENIVYSLNKPLFAIAYDRVTKRIINTKKMHTTF